MAASLEQDTPRIALLFAELESDLPHLVLTVSDTVSGMLLRHELDSASFLLQHPLINSIKHPYLDYVRIVAVLMAGDYEFAEDYLMASIARNPDTPYLKFLFEAIQSRIEPEKLIN